MASLNFTGLQKLELTPNRYTYSDLQLDFTDPITKDLASDYDEAAVKNSIFSLFNTVPGQNLLNPRYGLNLVQYLFEPVSETNANFIGNTIVNHLNVYEPRIRVTSLDVLVNEDEQTYNITLSIEIPALNNKKIKIPGTITKTGYIFS
jgi:phage baseplate assembly protein W